MNNNKLHKNNALFLAAVLMIGVGIFGISSPSMNAFAQEYENYGYEHEEEYDSYDPHQSEKYAQEYENYGYEHEEEYDSYDPHQSEKKNSKSSSNVLIANCELSLSNFNFIDQESNHNQDLIQTQNPNPSETVALNGQALTPEEALNAIGGNSNGNSEPLLDLNRNVVSVCFANNDNDVTQDQTFTGGEQLQAGGDQAQ